MSEARGHLHQTKLNEKFEKENMTMDAKIYFIHGDTYLDHIDDKLDMYGLLTELVRSVRSNLEAGETAQALRTLCAYEHKAHELYEDWCIPDEYTESGDPDDLEQLMEDDLIPADDDDDEEEDDSAAVRILRPLAKMAENAQKILAVAHEIAEFEDEIDRILSDSENEGPENACAE